MTKSNKRNVWVFQVDADVLSMMSKAINRKVGRNGNKRGLRTRMINSMLREALVNAGLKGKREL